jgi:hypothetical protein
MVNRDVVTACGHKTGRSRIAYVKLREVEQVEPLRKELQKIAPKTVQVLDRRILG